MHDEKRITLGRVNAEQWVSRAESEALKERVRRLEELVSRREQARWAQNVPPHWHPGTEAVN